MYLSLIKRSLKDPSNTTPIYKILKAFPPRSGQHQEAPSVLALEVPVWTIRQEKELTATQT